MYYTDIAKADDEEATYTEVENLCREFLPKFDQLGMKTEAIELLRVFDRLALYLQHHGKFDGAEKWLLNVAELAEKIAQQRPNDPAVLLVVARANKNLGLVYAKIVRLDDASVRFKAADTIFQRLTDEHPLILEYIDGQASNLMNSGGMESTRKEWSVALGLLQRALACQKKLVERQPDSFEYCSALPIFYSTLGNVATNQGKIDEALEYLRMGIEAKDVAQAMRPNDIQFEYFGAALTNNLANAYRAQGRYEEALPIYRSVIESGHRLIERNPTVDAYSKILAIACHNSALTQTKLGDASKAIASDLEAKVAAEKLLVRNPDSMDYRTLKMQIDIGLGQSYVQAFSLEDAKREFSDANAQLTKLMEGATNLTPYQNNLGVISLGFAQIAEQVGNFEDSLEWSEKAIAAFALHLQSLTNVNPIATQLARDSNCSSYRMKARALFRLKRNAEATEACNKALDFDTPEHGQAARALLARIFALSGDTENAKQAIEAIDPSLNLNFETLVDMAATIAILDREKTPDLANANGAKHVGDPRIVELLKRAAKRDAARFAMLREDPELTTQFVEWPEHQQAP